MVYNLELYCNGCWELVGRFGTTGSAERAAGEYRASGKRVRVVAA